MTVDTEIAEFMEHLRAAWQAADIDAYMTAFEDDADLVNRGGHWYRGRAAIAKALTEVVRTGRPELLAAERRTELVRIIAPTVAIVHEAWIEPDRIAHATYVLARRADGWRITATSVVLRQ